MLRLARPVATMAPLLVATALLAQTAPPSPPPEVRAQLAAWLEQHGRPPVEYVVGLFRKHDVVFLGEHHRIRHDPLLVQSLLGPLHAAGVRCLATEFARREDQPRIDSLLAAAEWHEDLARAIQFDQFVAWGYQEYVDVFRAAWELNRRLPSGAPRFRVLGVNDSPDWSWVRSDADRDDPEVMRKVWRGGGEAHWARVVLDVVGRGEKVLVYSGIHHAFTRFRQPVVAGGKLVRTDPTRMGNYVYDSLGARAVTVFLHSPWRGPAGYDDAVVHPADGAIDALMLERPGGPRPVGFDVAGSPFGALRPRNCVYRHASADFRLGDFCDGWIYTRPISRFEPVSWIEGWIHEGNLERARLQHPNPRARTMSAEQLNAWSDAERDVRRWRRLR